MERRTRLRAFAGALLLVSVRAHAGSAETLLQSYALAATERVVAVVDDAAGAAAQAGREVLVQGIARNAKLGAAVVSGDLHVYCLNLGHWPAQAHGQSVVVQGLLELSDEFVTPDGTNRAGTDGPIWVLRDCRQEPR